jgi:ankyrin repeat protein
MTAVNRGQERAVKNLLDMNIDPNAVDEMGRTPLMLAAAAGNGQLVQLLIDRGADVEAKTPEGLTAMSIATEFQKVESTEAIQDALVKASAAASEAERPSSSWKARDRRTWL